MAKRQCYWCGHQSAGAVCEVCGDDLDQQAQNLERWERERQERLEKPNRERAAEVRQD